MRKAKNKAEAEIILSVKEIKGKLFDRVIDLINEYTIVYGSPNFVKIPKWIYDSLISFRDYLNLDGGMPETLLGLKLCPTISINTIDEIEVF